MTSIPISVFSQNAAQYVAHAVNSQDVISVCLLYTSDAADEL